MHTSTDVPARRRPPSIAAIKSSGGSRHLRASNLPACSAPGRSRSTEVDALDEDTMELFLTPEQIYQLEESARLAFGQRAQQCSPQPPQLKVVSAPQSKVHALPPVAPIVVRAHALSEDVRREATPRDAISREESSTANNAHSRLPAPATSQAPERAQRRAPTITFPRRLFQLVIALLVPAVAIAAMIQVSAFHVPVTPLPASAIERTPLSAAPVAQISKPTTAAAEPAIAEPVKFSNPFDRSEIFEFPPGTTRQEARDAVAQILIDRASERRNRVRAVGQRR